MKLCDFGASINYDESIVRTRVGTFEYMAPEVIKYGLSIAGGPADALPVGPIARYDGVKADVFSCVLVLHRILFRDPAFVNHGPGGGGVERYISMAQAGSLLYQAPQGAEGFVTPACLQILTGMLQADPLARPSLKDVMASDWFNASMHPSVREAMGRVVNEELEPAHLQTEAEIDEVLLQAQHGDASWGDQAGHPLPIDEAEDIYED